MIQQIKLYLQIAAAIAIVGLAIWVSVLIKNNKDTELKYETAITNYRASISKNRVYKLQVDELTDQRDSISLAFAKANGVKPKNIKQLVYVQSTIQKRDTINFTDSIFVVNEPLKDTVIKNNWYTHEIKIIPPYTMLSYVQFRNEFTGYISEKREIVGTPSKLFFIRWFQKRHTVLECNFSNKNPYDSIQNYKITNIIK